MSFTKAIEAADEKEVVSLGFKSKDEALKAAQQRDKELANG